MFHVYNVNHNFQRLYSVYSYYKVLAMFPVLCTISLQLLKFLFIYLAAHCAACEILVPWPGINPESPRLGESPNHWTAREFASFFMLYIVVCSS